MVDLVLKDHLGKDKLSLPNSIAKLSDGCIAVADGGLDRVLVFDDSGNIVRSVGQTGLGKYSFKEPVAISSAPRGRIFVADWHNHRAVVFDEALTYLSELGHFSLEPPGQKGPSIRRVLQLFRSFFYGGTYIKKHFFAGASKSTRRRLPFLNAMWAMRYFLSVHGAALHSGLSRFAETGFDKPNGFAFSGRRVWIPQKNMRCIKVYWDEYPYQLLHVLKGPYHGMKFGRLGSISSGSCGRIYVCDEHNSVIYLFSGKDSSPVSLIGADSGVGKFLPFSCAEINERLVAVCGGFNIQIIDRIQNSVVYVSESLGELHDVLFDNEEKRLYVANRSEATILRFAVKLR